MTAAQVDTRVGVLDSVLHEGQKRACVHLLSSPPARLLLSRTVLAGLNFQPRVCPPPQACIASRTGDVLTVAFDAWGQPGARHRQDELLRWRYQLHAVDGDPGMVLAVKLP